MPNMRKTLLHWRMAAAVLLAWIGPQAMSQEVSVPALINYQGKLTDAAGAPLPNGTYGVAFKLWNKATGTSVTDLIWGRSYDVVVVGGAFNVVLGSDKGTPVEGAAFEDIAAAFTDPNRYLGLTILRDANGQVSANPQEISPRQRILTAPFAFVAGNGLPVGGIMPWLPPVPATTLAEVETQVPPGFRLCKGPNPDEQDDPRTPFDETLIPDFMDERFVVGGPPESAGTKVGSAEHVHSYAITTDGENHDGKMGSVNTPAVYYSQRHHSHLIRGETQPAVVVPRYLGVLFVIRVY